MLKDKILQVLKASPNGLTIKDISEKLGKNRITVVKYLFELKGEGKIRIRQVGRAKLIYLKKGGEAVANTDK